MRFYLKKEVLIVGAEERNGFNLTSDELKDILANRSQDIELFFYDGFLLAGKANLEIESVYVWVSVCFLLVSIFVTMIVYPKRDLRV